MFAIRGRRAWGARSATRRVARQQPQNVHTLVLHHTVGPAAYTKTAAITYMQFLQAYHQHHPDRQWADVGYNVVMDRFGRCWEGRGLHAIGAGASGHNTGYFHVAIMGDYTRIRLTLRQRLALRALQRRLRKHGFRFNRVLGHNQLPGHTSNACPGSIRRDLKL